MPPLAKKILTTAIWTVIWLIIFDIAGVVAAFALDILVSRHSSALLFYAVWCVAGVFCGFVHFKQSVDRLAKEFPEPEPEEGPEDEIEDEEEESEGMSISRRNGLVVTAVTAGVILIVVSLCYRFMWGGQGDVFVPDNVGLSITYFGSMLAATLLAHRSLG